jgi:hypothetical protein
MTRQQAILIAERLTNMIGVYHCAVRNTGDWDAADTGWHVESCKAWGVRIDDKQVELVNY